MHSTRSTVTKTPAEQIKILEKCIADGDIPGVAQGIGDLHEKWSSLSMEVQTDVMKLEAIFLTMLQARSKVR